MESYDPPREDSKETGRSRCSPVSSWPSAKRPQNNWVWEPISLMQRDSMIAAAMNQRSWSNVWFLINDRMKLVAYHIFDSRRGTEIVK